MEAVFAALLLLGGGILLAVVINAIIAFPLVWCWDAIMPTLFNLPTISWGEAFAMLFLVTFLTTPLRTVVEKK